MMSQGGPPAAAPARLCTAGGPLPSGRRGGALVKTRLHWREESQKTALRGQNRRSLEANRPIRPGNQPRRTAGRFGLLAKPQLRRPRSDAWSKPAFSVPTVKAGFDHERHLPVSRAFGRTDPPSGSVRARQGEVQLRPAPSGEGGAAPIFLRSRSRIAVWNGGGAPRGQLEGALRPEGVCPKGARCVSPAHGSAVGAVRLSGGAPSFPDRVF